VRKRRRVVRLSLASCAFMANAEASVYRVGQTALIAKVPDAEPLISSWRRQFDTTAAGRVPAHVTVLSQPGGRPSWCSVRSR
jgi:hypothetical protein